MTASRPVWRIEAYSDWPINGLVGHSQNCFEPCQMLYFQSSAIARHQCAGEPWPAPADLACPASDRLSAHGDRTV